MNNVPYKTTRDQLTAVIDVLRRAVRHAWLAILISVIGAGLSVLLALSQKPKYDSETVLLYQEKISQSVLQGRDVQNNNRNMATRLKEMLLSRTNLALIVDEFNLYPDIVEREGTIAAAEKLRLLVNFSTAGAGTYRISYRGTTPELAQKVTGRLASLLLERDEKVRREQVNDTQTFLANEIVGAENTLADAESEFAIFVAQHPEFVTDVAAGAAGGVGASIRAKEASAARAPSKPSGRSQIAALQRHANRLRKRIANPTAPLAPIVNNTRRDDSPALMESRRELADANRDLAAKAARFTPKHPDVIAAKHGVDEAKRRVRRIEEAEAANRPKPIQTPVLSASASLAELQKDLARTTNAINNYYKAGNKNKKSKSTSGSNEIVDNLVALETEHARLQRRVTVATERLGSWETRAFTAAITASAEFAEAAKLVVMEKAYLPARPAGKGRALIALAGTMAFGILGCAIALGLALVDDRVYRKSDIDDLGIAPVLAIIPKLTKNKKRLKRG